MRWTNAAFKQYFNTRYSKLSFSLKHPMDVQEALLKEMVWRNRNTEFGKQYNFNRIQTLEDYQKQVPLFTYEKIQPYIDRMMSGTPNVLWEGNIKWFSKSSGTTNQKSKFIPVTTENLEECHGKGPKDTMTLFYNRNPEATMFAGRGLIMGGSFSVFNEKADTKTGDVSAIMIHNMPWFAKPFLLPSVKVALMDDWEKKLNLMVEDTAHKDITNISGVPTWSLILLQKVLEYTGKDHILEVWPNFEVYVHGGVNFEPYRQQFDELLPSKKVKYIEVYNASEGYFAAQYEDEVADMVLLVNNGVFYEFLPLSEINSTQPKAISLAEVELDIQYAIIITTNAGLWRYMPGDTIKFTSKQPHRIKITGRTKQFINAFGEELIIENAELAISKTCKSMSAIVEEYTVGPVFLEGNKKGGHEWWIEFNKAPNDLEQFIDLLDENLQAINSDYEAKRFKDIALSKLRVKVVPKGAFLNWLKSKGKYGGQHKVPRLSNDRKYIEELSNYLKTQ